MEELLKTYAKKRRDDAGPSFELHPATRQLLHGEVVRRRAKSTGRFGSWLGLLAGLGPRIGFAASVLTVLGIVLWKFYPSGEATRKPAYVMAKTDREPAPLGADSRSSTNAGTGLAAPPSPAAPASIPPPAPRAKLEKSAVLRPADPPRLPALAAAPTPTAVEQAPALPSDFKDRGYSMRSVSSAPQQFTRARAAGRPDTIPKGSGQATILSTFDFYQTGNSIRIVDADGSVYEGPVIADESPELDKAKILRFEPAKELDALSQNGSSVRFRVSGTNRTVNQLVTFTGSFQPSTGTASMPQPSSAQTSGSTALTAARTPLSSTGATPGPARTLAGPVELKLQDTSATRSLPPARIQGRARIGKTEEMQIEAVPAAR